MPKRTPKTDDKYMIHPSSKKSLKVPLAQSFIENDVQGWESDSEAETPVSAPEFQIIQAPLTPPKSKNERPLKRIITEKKTERDAPIKKELPTPQRSPKPCAKRQLTEPTGTTSSSIATQVKPEHITKSYYKQYIRWKLRERSAKVDMESLLQRTFPVRVLLGSQSFNLNSRICPLFKK